MNLKLALDLSDIRRSLSVIREYTSGVKAIRDEAIDTELGARGFLDPRGDLIVSEPLLRYLSSEATKTLLEAVWQGSIEAAQTLMRYTTAVPEASLAVRIEQMDLAEVDASIKQYVESCRLEGRPITAETSERLVRMLTAPTNGGEES